MQLTAKPDALDLTPSRGFPGSYGKDQMPLGRSTHAIHGLVSDLCIFINQIALKWVHTCVRFPLECSTEISFTPHFR